jgi:hypothetical protein
LMVAIVEIVGQKRRPLRGGEEVRLLNLTAGGGAVNFALPRVSPEIEIRVKGREPALFSPHLDTVLFDNLLAPRGAALVVEMVFRAHVPAPRRMREATIVVRERRIS